jgi:hypothetical protein
VVREVSDAALARLLRDGAWTDALTRAGDAVLTGADAHGLAPLLHWRLRAVPGVPEALREALRQRALQAAAIELARRAELVRVLALLHAQGLEPVLLKGAALAHTLYPEPHLRPCVDVDLMVAPAQRGAVAALLRAEGYATTAFQGGELVNAQSSYWRDLPAGAAMTFDVHWRIATSPLFAHVLTHAWLRGRARPVLPLGPHALGPAPVDALLHGCLHRAGVVARHPRGDRLIWLHDLHLLAAPLDRAGWDEFLELCGRHRVRGLCRRALEAVAAAFGTAIPPHAQAALARARDEPAEALSAGHPLRLKWAELRALPTWMERARYVRETVLPAPEYVLERYQERRRWLLPALYVRRAFGWLGRA